MLYTIVLFLLFFLAFRFIKPLRIDGLNNWSMPVAYALKVAVGFYFLYVYTEVYGHGSLTADAGAFMTESKVLNEVFFTSPGDYFKLLFGFGDQEALVATYLQETSHWDSGAQAIISDNRNILRVHSVIHFFSFNDAAVHVLVACILSLVGIRQLFLGVKDRVQIANSSLFLILILFPSVLFWTSGILKEPLMILGFGLFIRGILGDVSTQKRWIYGLLGCLLMLGFKPYVFFCIIPAALFFLIHTLLPRFKTLLSFLILFLLASSFALIFSGQREKAVHLLSRKQYDFKNVGKGGIHVQADTCFYFFKPDQIPELIIEGDSASIDKPMDALIMMHGSIDEPQPVHIEPEGQKWFIYFRNDRSDGFIHVTLINDSFAQLMWNIPEALLNSIFRPHFIDPGSWLKYPAMFETTILFLFLLLAIARRRKLEDRDRRVLWSMVVFIICLSLIIGWVTPVLGAIVRYRIPVYICLLLIGLFIYKPKVRHE